MLRRLVVAGTLLCAVSSAHAVAPRGAQQRLQTLTAMPAAKANKPLRTQPMLRFGAAGRRGAGWQKLATTGKWDVAWDAATGVPSRIWGEGIPAPGTIASAQVAEAFARKMLAEHIELLAPGSQVSDFELVSNVYDGNIRAIGFVQKAGGMRVLGGQVSFRFKADRLFVIGSEALPNVVVAQPTARALRTHMIDAVRRDLGLRSASVTTEHDVILPLVADDTVLGYRVVTPAVVEEGVERYVAYTDVATGDVIAARDLNVYANGTVIYRGVDRYPGKGRLDQPAPRVQLRVNGSPTTTSVAGGVSWSPDSAATLSTSIVGDLATVINKASGGTAATADLAISPGGQTVWDPSASVEDDAQVAAYLATNTAKAYVREYIDASMPTLEDQMTVNVNIQQDCNAFFDGKSINFFRAGAMCENTARINDVVYHEYGHRVHTAEIIEGVGNFDGAMSEGAADFLAALITNDSGMGRGFFYTDLPLRELDPPMMEWLWPFDIGEIHHTGQIFGGVFWDLRKTLVAQLGEDAGERLVAKLYVGAMRRSINIQTSLIETLATDDNDGNLENGTPHECAIRDAFGRHGLRTASGSIEAPGTLSVNAKSIGVVIDVTGISGRCTGDEVTGAKLEWHPSYTGVPAPGIVDAAPAGPNRFFAELPLASQEVVFYQAKVQFSDGSTMILADNLADQYYQIYTGETVKLYCTDFETADPFAEGWTTGVDTGKESQWEWGTPTGGSTDPHFAYSGSKVLAQKLNGDYEPKQTSWVKAPTIDVRPYSEVRLQYRRWLAVEDSHYDEAKVTANGNKAWINFTQNQGDSSSYHHLDREWRFHDVPLSGFFSGKNLTVGWEIKSDEGLNLGGWTLDDVCIVANPNAICGDGVKTITEGCDEGLANADEPDRCRTDCHRPACGDNIVDTYEECDEGPEGTDTCSKACKVIDIEPVGCCSADGGKSSGLLALLVGLALTRRGRTRERRSRAR